MRPFLPTLSILIPILAPIPGAIASDAARPAARERLVVPPLDTASTSITLDSALAPASLVEREFHPAFAAAIARAARRVEVVRGEPSDDSSARYVLRLDSLGFSLKTRAAGRRFVPPSPPEFDPATGEMTPGQRRGHAEGPGWMNTLAATAKWTVWDRAGDSALARGTSSGAATFRGEARREDRNRAARELAKAVLRGTPFSPFR